jgi:ABC-type Fe3+/spermidine/putrescine transport system ATPase subunit
MLFEITHLCKRFGRTTAVDDINLTVDEGEIVCLLGPSGCGKTTLLRLIAGLETADRGTIRFDGQEIANVPVHQRNFGFMFQDFALFPHKNVAQNVAFGLRMANLERQAIDARVRDVLELVGLTDFHERSIDSLSGGEQQRVALARSLAPNPRLLLLDEPLGSLDRALRERLMNELRTILKKVRVTAITVTHDQQEAFALADKIVVMSAGRASQVGTPEEVYRRPSSTSVARFLGLTNLLEGRILPADPTVVHTILGAFRVENPSGVDVHAFDSRSTVMVLLRPEAASVCATDASVPLQGTLTGCSFRGAHYQIQVTHPAGPCLTFALRANPADLTAIGESIQLYLDANAITLLPNPI